MFVGFLNLFMWLYQVLVVALGSAIFLEACQIFSYMRILSCGMQDLDPWPGVKPRPPAPGAWSPSHWTAREVPIVLYFTYQDFVV